MTQCTKKAILAIVIGSALTLGFKADAFTHSPKSWSARPCKTSVVQKVLREKAKDLQGVLGCKVEKIPLEHGPQNVSLVYIQYGQPMDCPSGCIYNVYTALVIQDQVFDFDGPPNLDQFLAHYGDWCQLNPPDIKNKKIHTFITQRNGMYYWGYRLNNFDNRLYVKHLLATSPRHRASDKPQYCQWNGEVVFTGDRLDLKSVDTSRLTFTQKPWPKATKRSVASLLKECRAGKLPAYQGELGRIQCINEIAYGKKDVKICDALTLKDLYKSSVPPDQHLQEQRAYCRESVVR